MFLFHGHFHWDEHKPKGLELVAKANGMHIFLWKFCLGILDYLSKNPVFAGNFPFGKTKLSLAIYIPTEISGVLGKSGVNNQCLCDPVYVFIATSFAFVSTVLVLSTIVIIRS